MIIGTCSFLLRVIFFVLAELEHGMLYKHNSKSSPIQLRKFCPDSPFQPVKDRLWHWWVFRILVSFASGHPQILHPHVHYLTSSCKQSSILEITDCKPINKGTIKKSRGKLFNFQSKTSSGAYLANSHLV